MICNIHKFREKMNAGKFCLGPGITFKDPAVTEALCDSVDFFWIDLEHNPTSLESMTTHLMAARAGGTPALVRVPSDDIGWIKRVLDSGAEGIILPQAKSAAEIQSFVSACHYPPMGTRGFGPRRPSNYGRVRGSDYVKQANEQLFVVAQIETVSALNEIDQIVQIRGLDSLVIGPYDLSGSMGMLGEVHHPKILDAIRTIVTKGRAAGLYLGMGMGASVEHAVEAASLGVHWAQCGNDFEYMIRSADQLYAAVRDKI
ncbi:MAG: hypothetical protein FJ267_03955 [Planctomycetes bacterium]|nr:hypothetical protein [Planctomycetota bacterium]